MENLVGPSVHGVGRVNVIEILSVDGDDIDTFFGGETTIWSLE